MNELLIPKLRLTNDVIIPAVPASKSLLNRALLLAAFSGKRMRILCGDCADDTEALLGCLAALGISVIRERDGYTVCGCRIPPVRRASLDVRSAGTAARFLPVFLAFAGGSYEMTASAQMQARPTEILPALEAAGARIEYRGERGHYPFVLHSDGSIAASFTLDTDRSTQYASAVLLAAACLRPATVHLTGSRTDGSYIQMTIRQICAFGAQVTREGDTLTVTPSACFPDAYEVENDLSGACYFYALALLLGARVCVPRIHADTLQGDKKFLSLLEEKGVRIHDTPDGILADASGVRSFTGWDADMRDFSDQALTLAALAPFAATPTHIRGVGHIRRQECDRIRAICENMTRLGVPAEAREDGVTIFPAPPRKAVIQTYGDHRVAMAFALVGAMTGNVTIRDPDCCKKTFPAFFDVLLSLPHAER